MNTLIISSHQGSRTTKFNPCMNTMYVYNLHSSSIDINYHIFRISTLGPKPEVISNGLNVKRFIPLTLTCQKIVIGSKIKTRCVNLIWSQKFEP